MRGEGRGTALCRRTTRSGKSLKFDVSFLLKLLDCLIRNSFVLIQARARSVELQKALSDARSQLSHADDFVMALKKEGDKVEQQHQQQLRSLQDELTSAKLNFESRFTELQSTSQAEIEDLNNQLLSTKADLEEAQVCT